MTKALVTGDWHFGEHNNSTKHNEYLLEFIDFLDEQAKVYKADTLIIAGDYFHDRNKIDVQTLKYGIRGAKKLQSLESIKTIHLLAGNHDLYQRYSRDVSSLDVLEPFLNVYYEEHYDKDLNCVFVPWVSNENDHRSMNRAIQKHQPKFVFAHLEMNGFRMNKNYIMDQGTEIDNLPWYNDVEKVFTGHYHKRQDFGKICYVGSPFPFDMNDANDFERGVCVLDTETGEYSFEDFTKVKIVNIDYETYNKIKDDLDEHTRVAIQFGSDFDFDKMNEVQEELESKGVENFKFKYESKKQEEHHQEIDDVKELDSIDEAVIQYIEEAELGDYDKNLLKQVYQEASDT